MSPRFLSPRRASLAPLTLVTLALLWTAAACTGPEDLPIPDEAIRAQEVLYPLAQTYSNDALWPAANLTDGNDTSAYSSKGFASAINDRGTEVAAWFPDGVHAVSQVRLTARVSSHPGGIALYGFPKRYQIQITNPEATAWVSMGVYTTQPDSSGVAIVDLGGSFQTGGVRIIPQELSDDGGGYYFQLAEIRLGSALQTSYAMGSVFATEQLDAFTWAANHLIDGNPATYYSSPQFRTTQNSLDLLVVAGTAGGLQQVSRVVLRARMQGGVALAFPAEYDLLVTNPENTAFILAGHFSIQPNPAGVATIDLGHVYTTNSVLLRPTVLGRDNYGNAYLQLAEIGLARDASSGESGLLTSPILLRAKQVFSPNQLAANLWYLPRGTAINGHLDGSFSDTSVWPELLSHLRANDGGFGTFAAELGYVSSGTLMNLRQAGVPVSVETPGMTQCLSGWALGNLELFGTSPPGQNLFASTFLIDGTQADRIDPAGRGWFVNRDGNRYTPDEIIFDERMPNLLKRFSGAALFDGTKTWAERKALSVSDPCPAADSFHFSVNRITSLIADYVDYIRVARSRFGRVPRFAIHWNVNPGWEWSDETCLDALDARFPNAADFARERNALSWPCHRDTQHLGQLVDTLCANGACPSAVYMDVDYLYNTTYALDVLQRNKAALASRGIPFGINVVDQSTAIRPVGSAVVVNANGSGLQILDAGGDGSAASENLLHQTSMINVMSFFIYKGIIDASTRLRLSSWDYRAYESGLAVSERNAHSMADTVNRIFRQLLIPIGAAR